MRVWAILNQRSLKVLKWGEYYNEYGDYPLKMVDEEFIKENVQTPSQGVIDTQPVQGFLRVSRWAAGLSLSELYSNFRHILTVNGLNYRFAVMWELEVPEGFIYSLKPWDRSYQRYSQDMPSDTPKKERYKYLELINGDLVVRDNFKNAMRHKYENDALEVMIPYLYLPHVVCYRTFEDVDHSPAVKVSTTVLRPDALPLWTEDVYCGGDHYARSSVFPHASVSSIDQSRICGKLGMAGAPRYYTLAEALQCCNEETYKIIHRKVAERKVPPSRFSYVEIKDLFPDGLRL